MRLVRPDAEVSADTKVSAAINNVFQTWKEGAASRLTQVAFCDISTPSPSKFNVYDEIKARLIARGIPEKEIAYIHDADTDAKKKILFDSVNAGRVRILLGSTEKMGAGTNVQKKLWVLHHLDAPWRPRDIEQRDGRILRQILYILEKLTVERCAKSFISLAKELDLPSHAAPGSPSFSLLEAAKAEKPAAVINRASSMLSGLKGA